MGAWAPEAGWGRLGGPPVARAVGEGREAGREAGLAAEDGGVGMVLDVLNGTPDGAREGEGLATREELPREEA